MHATCRQRKRGEGACATIGWLQVKSRAGERVDKQKPNTTTRHRHMLCNGDVPVVTSLW